MHVLVLGSAAGGGFPQWNCNCDNCAGFRNGTVRATARTQSSIAVSADGKRWLLINASPDVRAQINAAPALQPSDGRRGSGMVAVLLMDGQIDHATGLLTLREGEALQLYCTEPVYEDLSTGLPLVRVLDHYCGTDHHVVPLDRTPFTVEGVPGLRLTAVPLSSKAPPYSPHRNDPHPGDNIGLLIDDEATGGRLFYAPGLGTVDANLSACMGTAQCLLVDGSFWTDDEMQRRGVGRKTAAAMGHLPQSGPHGMIQALRNMPDARRILIHINNTNPILDESSPEREQLDAEGIEVAFDGMKITL